MTTPDERWVRYLRWFEGYFGEAYPSCVQGDEPRETTVRFLYALDCAALLISEDTLTSVWNASRWPR